MRKRKTKTQRWNAEQAHGELALWKASGLTLSEFSRQRGYHAQRLWWWHKQGRTGKTSGGQSGEQTTGPMWVEATVADIAAGPPVVVDTGGGMRIEVGAPQRVCPRWVATVATQLSQRG